LGYLQEAVVTDAIILSGASGVGKSTLARILVASLNARVINAGDVVWAAVRELGVQPVSRSHAGQLFLDELGELALGPLLLRLLRPSELVVIDGLRLPFAKELLDLKLRSIFHLHLTVPEEVRIERLLRRDGHVPHGAIAESYLPLLARSADLILPQTGARVPSACQVPQLYGQAGLCRRHTPRLGGDEVDVRGLRMEIDY
jgi:adenylate kinase family enzyme